MKKILLLTALSCSIFSLKAQDKIFKRNGLLIFAEVKQLTDSGIVYKDDLGVLKTVPYQSVRAIQYAIGNVLPISGAMARKYRDEAYVRSPRRSDKQVSVNYFPINKALTVGFERFLDKNQHTSLSGSFGFGLGPVKNYPMMPLGAQTIWITNVSWRRYPSLLRKVRFHYGFRIESSLDKAEFKTMPYYGYHKPAPEYLTKISARFIRLEGGPEIGLCGYVAPNVSVGAVFSPMIGALIKNYESAEMQWADWHHDRGSTGFPQLTFTVAYTLKK